MAGADKAERSWEPGFPSLRTLFHSKPIIRIIGGRGLAAALFPARLRAVEYSRREIRGRERGKKEARVGGGKIENRERPVKYGKAERRTSITLS